MWRQRVILLIVCVIQPMKIIWKPDARHCHAIFYFLRIEQCAISRQKNCLTCQLLCRFLTENKNMTHCDYLQNKKWCRRQFYCTQYTVHYKRKLFPKKKKLRLDNFALFRRRILLLICRTLHFIPVKNPRYVRLKGTYTIYINRLRNIKIH